MWLKKKGLPDANALRTLSERYALKEEREETSLPVQNSTPAQKVSGSAEKQVEVASPPETIPASIAEAASGPLPTALVSPTDVEASDNDLTPSTQLLASLARKGLATGRRAGDASAEIPIGLGLQNSPMTRKAG
jgi:hypothetical protein